MCKFYGGVVAVMVWGANEVDMGTAGAVGIGMVLTALAGALVVILKGRNDARIAANQAQAQIDDAERRGKTQARRDVIAEWQEFADKLEKKSERQDAVIRDQQLAITALSSELGACREDHVQARTAIHFLYEHMANLYAQAKTAGVAVSDMPDLPSLREHENHGKSDFAMRQAAQATALMKDAAQTINPPESTTPPPKNWKQP